MFFALSSCRKDCRKSKKTLSAKSQLHSHGNRRRIDTQFANGAAFPVRYCIHLDSPDWEDNEYLGCYVSTTCRTGWIETSQLFAMHWKFESKSYVVYIARDVWLKSGWSGINLTTLMQLNTVKMRTKGRRQGRQTDDLSVCVYANDHLRHVSVCITMVTWWGIVFTDSDTANNKRMKRAPLMRDPALWWRCHVKYVASKVTHLLRGRSSYRTNRLLITHSWRYNHLVKWICRQIFPFTHPPVMPSWRHNHIFRKML